jgi:16S rRNA C967 or C1407 C5-methylase (RsmB/RsmF family)/NOL1/NOP2/fmu family ribosome biogenesis protein
MLPPDFILQMQHLLKEEFSLFQKSLAQAAPVSIRVNPRKSYSTPADEKILWSEFGYYLNQRPEFVFDPAWHAGAYYVQEASSMFLEQVFKQLISGSNNINVLDLCAAPGGKSTHILSLVSENSLLVSNETISSRNNILRENIVKWGHPNVAVTQNDPKDFQRLPRFFDVIVVDAPCSGEGLFRKDANAIKEWSKENVAHCALRQKRILADVIPALKPDGILIYSTCTYNVQEDEEQVAHLINHFGFQPVALNIPESMKIKYATSQHGYHFYPHLLKGEGFFMAVLRKEEGDELADRRKPKGINIVYRKDRNELDNLIKNASHYEWVSFRDNYYFFPAEKTETLKHLIQQLKVTAFGTEAATIKQQLLPLHPLSVSIAFNDSNYGKINLTLPEAIEYLRKENISVNGNNGWNTIFYNHLPLGFAKQSANRINNYYPVEWRIRKK